MSQTAVKTENKPTLTSMAREALADLDGNVEKATSRVLYRLRGDPKLLKLVVEAAIEELVALRVNEIVRHQRQSILHQHTRDRVVALAEGMLPCLLDLPLAGGLKLRDATRNDLIDQIHRYETQAGDMMHKARWLGLVLQSVPEGKRVGQILEEKRVKELFEETKNAN